MEFQNSQTFINLARSFAGESQAGMRYQLIAKQATAEAMPFWRIISHHCENETYHAENFFQYDPSKCGKYR